MSSIQLEDYELDKSSDYSTSTDVGARNMEKASILLGTLEVFFYFWEYLYCISINAIWCSTYYFTLKQIQSLIEYSILLAPPSSETSQRISKFLTLIEKLTKTVTDAINSGGSTKSRWVIFEEGMR